MFVLKSKYKKLLNKYADSCLTIRQLERDNYILRKKLDKFKDPIAPIASIAPIAPKDTTDLTDKYNSLELVDYDRGVIANSGC